MVLLYRMSNCPTSAAWNVRVNGVWTQWTSFRDRGRIDCTRCVLYNNFCRRFIIVGVNPEALATTIKVKYETSRGYFLTLCFFKSLRNLANQKTEDTIEKDWEPSQLMYKIFIARKWWLRQMLDGIFCNNVEKRVTQTLRLLPNSRHFLTRAPGPSVRHRKRCGVFVNKPKRSLPRIHYAAICFDFGWRVALVVFVFVLRQTICTLPLFSCWRRILGTCCYSFPADLGGDA